MKIIRFIVHSVGAAWLVMGASILYWIKTEGYAHIIEPNQLILNVEIVFTIIACLLMLYFVLEDVADMIIKQSKEDN